MIWLIVGVVLWSSVHAIPSLARPLRGRLIERLGDGPYKGLFALSIVLALVLIVVGWRSTPEVYVYVLEPWSRTVGFGLMIVAFILFGASQYKTAINRYIRHPQLTSVVIWAVSHLLMNGTIRALVLFGGLGVWALIEIQLINRRKGAWERPEAPPFRFELRGLMISMIIFVIVLFLHPYFAGVTPFPR